MRKNDLLYIMNPNCGGFKKADPVVEALREKDIKSQLWM